MNRLPRLLSPAWLVLAVTTCLVVYLYTFSEWLFFVTKPSFMSGMTIWFQIKIFLLSAFGLCAISVFGIGILAVVARILHRTFASSLLANIGLLIPALVVSSLILLLVDNFTYTVFQFGIVSTERLLRALYGGSLVALMTFVYLRLESYIRVRSQKKEPVQKLPRTLLMALLLVSATLSVFENWTGRGAALSRAGNFVGVDRFPNIILLGSDGLDATHLSVYGYARATTPNIRALLPDGLMAENALPNSGTTAGSIASILTGKSPIEIRVIYYPNILQGEDSYQHLPGILKRLGYYTADLSVPFYGDALTLNMLDGFDVVNQRAGTDSFILKILRALGGGDSSYFVDIMLQRISERLLHILFIKPMVSSFAVVTQPAERGDEQERFDKLLEILEDSTSPVFVHVHMLGTHGPRFEIRQPVFSAGQEQTKDWMMDYYDDAILDFDQYVGGLFDYLSESGQLQNTLVILYSDHGRSWEVHQRIPLIFWFPGGEYVGRIRGGVQNIDIAPTILDYLNVPIPEWMDGRSLVQENVEPPEFIFSASLESSLVEVSKEGIWALQMERVSPPFYQVGYVGLVACHQWYELYLYQPGLLHGEIKGYTEPCDPLALPTVDHAIQILLDHLSQYGFDISSFPASIPIHQVP